MRRTMMIWLMTLCSVALAGAQTGTKPDAAQKKDAPTTVSGCLASAPAGGFQLTNATMASATAQEKAGEKARATGVTYMLTGGENLKAHVGHRVEITGTLTTPSAAGEKPPVDKPAAGKPEIRGTLAVTSLKMISTTCP